MRAIVATLLVALGTGLASSACAEPTPQPLTLEDAISRALSNSPLLNARDAAIAGSLASVDQAGVRPNPELTVEIENFTGTGPFSELGAAETTLTYAQPLERGSKRRARVALAQSDRGIAELERLRATADIAFEVQSAWIDVIAAQAGIADAEAALRQAEDMAAIVRRRVTAARDPLAAGLKADNKVADARGRLDQARRLLALAEETLAALIGGDSPAIRIDPASFRRMPVPPPGGAAPDLAVAEARIDRAERAYRVEKTRAKQDPTIGVGLRRFEDGGDVAGLVSFSMPLAFFDRNRGNIDRAMAERQEAEWTLAEARRKHAAALRRAHAERDAARAEVAMLRDELMPRAQEAARSARDGYDQGAFAYLEVADTQQALVDLSSRETAALRNFHQSQARIDRLAGRWTAFDAAKVY
jgi:cobalt-zinc-cadmium efflux system outer membrane protein